jgi:hypothetical protein
MVIVMRHGRVLIGMSTVLDCPVMKKLNALLLTALLGCGEVSAWAKPDAVRAAQQAKQAQQQAQRNNNAVNQVRPVPSQPLAPPVMPVASPQQPAPMLQPPPQQPQFVQGSGGPRRLTPEERQQLRDQIRDARRTYQQGP